MKNEERAFTMIELMLVVAVIAILAAVAIPQYMDSVKRSYLNEVTSAFAAIKSAEESYFTNNGCYTDAGAWPTTIPAGGKATAWDTGTVPEAWSNSGLNVRPDRLVRFQYTVYASNAYNNAGCGATNTRSSSYPGAQGCVADPTTYLVPTSMFATNWYLVVARGDLTSGGVASNIISAIDDSTVIMCNELE